MTLQMWYAIIILTIAIILFITEWLRVDIVAMGVVIALMLTRLLTPQEAFSGFSNTAVLTITALFVVGGAILHTGLAGLIGRRILKIAGTSQTRLIVVVMITVAILSGFMSDTGTVAVLLPAIISLAYGAKISPSKLLIPLSFGSLLGGAATLIGTPPNLIVSDLLKESGLEPFSFFDYTPIGIILIIVGILFMVFIGQHILPNIKNSQDLQRVETPDELINIYQLPDNLFRLRVRYKSKLAGQSIADAKLSSTFNITILEILRPIGPKPVFKWGEQQLVLQNDKLETIRPKPDTIININDTLIVQGNGNNMSHAAAIWNLGIQPTDPSDQQSLITDEVGLAEIVIPPRSSLRGKNLVQSRFGTLYHLTVLGINRPTTNQKLNLKETILEFGDSLLVQGTWQNILALKKKRRDFIIMGQPEAMLGSPNRSKAPLALLILLGMLILMVSKLIPVATASMLAALLMVLAGCLSMDEAYEVVDWKSVVLIAGMLPMSTALENVGLVDLVAKQVTQNLGGAGPIVIMATLFLLTTIFTQVLSNTATTVLIAPIALATATELGLSVYPFLMAVAIAASMAFASPVASPVNTLVMGAGSYRFSDYIKVGGPLILIMLGVTLIFVPLLWPFQP